MFIFIVGFIIGVVICDRYHKGGVAQFLPNVITQFLPKPKSETTSETKSGVSKREK